MTAWGRVRDPKSSGTLGRWWQLSDLGRTAGGGARAGSIRPATDPLRTPARHDSPNPARRMHRIRNAGCRVVAQTDPRNYSGEILLAKVPVSRPKCVVNEHGVFIS